MHLVYGVVRHQALLESVLQEYLRTQPRALLHAALLLGAFELLEHPHEAAVIIHHAVDETRRLTSPREAGLVNAVLRRVPASLATVLGAEPISAPALARRFSHPLWLVERWLSRWGRSATRALLEWNQQAAEVFARVIPGHGPALPAFFRSTAWPGFYRLDQANWDEVDALLRKGRIYLQNPATALAPGLLAPRKGESILDVGAAPGGKTLLLAEGVGPTGRITAVNLPGPRLERLRANVVRYAGHAIDVVAADGTHDFATSLGPPATPLAFDAALVDVPCSNTGVLRHRVDAKWRIKPEDLVSLPELQGRLLANAAAVVRPGGRLVYSTCSLEPEENEDVVRAFLATAGDEFRLVDTRLSRPPESGCDGAGAFLLQRE